MDECREADGKFSLLRKATQKPQSILISLIEVSEGRKMQYKGKPRVQKMHIKGY